MFLSSVLIQTDLTPLALDWQAVCMRLLCAMIVGMVIGTEREYTHRPAGMRTHILVTLGACAVMITGQMIFVQYRTFGGNADPARLSAQVITGVGFLGAGTILQDGTNVKGLTTAASLWAVACLGIAAGAGYYVVSLAGMIFIFITLTLFEVIQNKLVGTGSDLHHYRMETSDITQGLEALNNHVRKQKASLHDIHTQRQGSGTYLVTFRVYFGGYQGKKRRALFYANLTADDAVVSLRLWNAESATLY